MELTDHVIYIKMEKQTLKWVKWFMLVLKG